MAAPLPFNLNEVDPFDAWKPWLPTKNEWSRKWVAHLFRRAAFGAKPAEIDRSLSEGFSKTLERLLVGAPDASELSELFSEIGQHCKDAANLRAWWLRFMVEGGHPLREKLTLFWHNHFSTSIAKVREIRSMFEQNITLRKNALGKFGPFLLEMSKNPAMLVWLDSNQNVKEAPNENYARELMELFSLGVGNYAEKDIREVARAFTGWHTNSAPNGEAFEYNPTEHDEGSKTVFGRTGNWNGEDIVRLCCSQPACAKFLVGKLYTFLVSEAPPPKGLLAPLEEQFRKSDYDIADLAKTMLGSRLFFSEHAYRKRVKWPVEYAIEAFRSMIPGPIPLSTLVDSLAGMGQVLFAPPNVKGWRTGTDWLNSATLLARNNFAERVALGGDPPSLPESAQSTPKPVPLGTPVAPSVSSTSFAPPPPPGSNEDPITTLYAADPKDVATLVKRMGELLYGERLSPTHAARIEKFLREPLLAPRINSATSIPPQNYPMPGSVPALPTSTGGYPYPALLITPIKPLKADQPELAPLPSEVVAKRELAPLPREVVAKPAKLDLDSPEFKARVREALHAMMCLPEYQLN